MTKLMGIVFMLSACTASGSAGFGSSTTASEEGTSSSLDNSAWSPPGHWTVKEKQAWQLLREELERAVQLMNQNCGTKIQVELDYETYRGKFHSDERYGLDAYGRAHMTAPVQAVDDLCKNGGNERSAIASGIKRILIAHNAERTKSTVALDAGVLRASFDPEIESASAYYDTSTDWIKEHL